MARTFASPEAMPTSEDERLERAFDGTRQRAHHRGKQNIRRYNQPLFLGSESPESNHEALDVEARMAKALMPQDPNARPTHFANNFEEAIFVFTVMMATAATTFLQGVIVINTVAIGENLHMTDSQITWIAASIG